MADNTSFPLWAPPFGVCLWLFVGAILSQLSRWPELAKRFPGTAAPDGPRLTGQVVSIGYIGESNVTSLVPTPQGLGLRAMILFRFRRAPVLVPWADVKYISTRKSLGIRTYLFELGGITTIRVTDRAFQEIARFIPGLSHPHMIAP